MTPWPDSVTPSGNAAAAAAQRQPSQPRIQNQWRLPEQPSVGDELWLGHSAFEGWGAAEPPHARRSNWVQQPSTGFQAAPQRQGQAPPNDSHMATWDVQHLMGQHERSRQVRLQPGPNSLHSAGVPQRHSHPAAVQLDQAPGLISTMANMAKWRQQLEAQGYGTRLSEPGERHSMGDWGLHDSMQNVYGPQSASVMQSEHVARDNRVVRLGDSDDEEDAFDLEVLRNRRLSMAVSEPGFSTDTRKQCKCRKSQCLKLYCECFAAQVFCQDCACSGCHNKPEFLNLIQTKHTQLKIRNRRAFDHKIQGQDAGQQVQHSKGCKCKRSNCLKKYCECFQGRMRCGDQCKCTDCMNIASMFQDHANLMGLCAAASSDIPPPISHRASTGVDASVSSMPVGRLNTASSLELAVAVQDAAAASKFPALQSAGAQPEALQMRKRSSMTLPSDQRTWLQLEVERSGSSRQDVIPVRTPGNQTYRPALSELSSREEAFPGPDARQDHIYGSGPERSTLFRSRTADSMHSFADFSHPARLQLAFQAGPSSSAQMPALASQQQPLRLRPGFVAPAPLSLDASYAHQSPPLTGFQHRGQAHLQPFSTPAAMPDARPWPAEAADYGYNVRYSNHSSSAAAQVSNQHGLQAGPAFNHLQMQGSSHSHHAWPEEDRGLPPAMQASLPMLEARGSLGSMADLLQGAGLPEDGTDTYFHQPDSMGPKWPSTDAPRSMALTPFILGHRDSDPVVLYPSTETSNHEDGMLEGLKRRQSFLQGSLLFGEIGPSSLCQPSPHGPAAGTEQQVLLHEQQRRDSMDGRHKKSRIVIQPNTPFSFAGANSWDHMPSQPGAFVTGPRLSYEGQAQDRRG